MLEEEIASTYDKAYSHDGLMGTEVDKEYSQETKTKLWEMVSEIPDKSKVLDLGAGVGDLWQFKNKPVDGYATDISLVGAKKTMERFPEVKATQSNADYLPYSDDSFAAVIAADVLEHVVDLDKTLQELKRIIIADGVLAVNIPVPDSLKNWGKNLLIRKDFKVGAITKLLRSVVMRTFLFGKPTFQPIDRDLNQNEWISSFEKNGFSIESSKEWPSPPQKPLCILIKLKNIK